MYRSLILLLVLFAGSVNAHEFTPAYPKLRPSWMEGIWMTELSLFNKRQEILYYEIGVFDKDWNKVKFATPKRIEKVPYLVTENIEIYIKDEDVANAVYICSTSKILKNPNGGLSQAISSKICSKIKK